MKNYKMNGKCRLCGEIAKELLNVFKGSSLLPNLKLRINLSLQILISQSDRFSHSICQTCFLKLQELDEFIRNCQKTQFVFSKIRDTVNVEMEVRGTSFSTNEYIPLFVDSAVSKISYTSHSTMECDGLETSKNNEEESSGSLGDNFASKEVMEISLHDYVGNIDPYENLDNTPGNDISTVSKKIPFSKLITFFSSRIQLHKSAVDTIQSRVDEQDSRNIDEVYENTSNDDAKKDDCVEDGEIKIMEVKCEKSSEENKVLNSSSTGKSSMSDMKSEKAVLTRTDIKAYKSNTRSSKLKVPTLKNCPICAHQFARNEIEDHIKFHSDDEEYLKLIISEMKEVPFKQKMHYCEECKKVFVRDSLYMEHLKEHSKIKMISCHLCDHTFSLRKKLKVHLRAVHIPKNSKCDQCSYAAKTLTDLQKHKRGVHEHQPIICEICGKSVSSNVSNYNRHLQTHSEERPYKCSLCDACYKTAASLQKHRENIHFPKSVMCTACGTICGSKIKYKKHVRRCKKRMLRYN